LFYSRTETRTETDSEGKSITKTEHYSSSQLYLNESIVILCKDPEQSYCFLEYGEHTFPFQYVLPHNLPPSFQHPTGQIHYYVKGTVELLKKHFW
jgi:hypothetical protein